MLIGLHCRGSFELKLLWHGLAAYGILNFRRNRNETRKSSLRAILYHVHTMPPLWNDAALTCHHSPTQRYNLPTANHAKAVYLSHNSRTAYEQTCVKSLLSYSKGQKVPDVTTADLRAPSDVVGLIMSLWSGNGCNFMTTKTLNDTCWLLLPFGRKWHPLPMAAGLIINYWLFISEWNLGYQFRWIWIENPYSSLP